MELFKSSNPVLTDKAFETTVSRDDTSLMTVKGTMAKFGLLLFLTLAGAVYTWTMLANYQVRTMYTLMWVGIIGGFVAAIIMSFNPKSAKYLAPVYSILEGFFLGGISVVVQTALQQRFPNVVFQAVGLTFAVALSMFLLYNFKVIKPTKRFQSIIISATMGVAVFYLITFVLGLFHLDVSFMYGSSLLSIGIGLVVTAIAALNLILDFDQIEKGAAFGAPKYMEWFSAFGLLVTIVWLYIEILKLFMRFAGRRN